MLSEAPSAKADEFLFGVLTEHLITTGRPTWRWNRDQRKDEIISNYIAELRKLTLSYEFREVIEEAIETDLCMG